MFPIKVGMTGFEPATSRSQGERSNQTELHPENTKEWVERDLNPHSTKATELQSAGLSSDQAYP